MLQRRRIQPLPLATFILFWTCCFYSLNGVVSDPQTRLLNKGCSQYNVSNLASFNNNLNATFQSIRDQVSTQRKLFVTSNQGNGETPFYALFQCRNYLSAADCLVCFDVAAAQIRNCSAGANGGRVIYDGCFLRYESSSFYDQTTQPGNSMVCGNKTSGDNTTFDSTVQQLLINLQTATPRIMSFFAATKTQVPNDGPTVYAIAQCVDTVTDSGCLECLKVGSNNLKMCLPTLEGRAFDAGCFMRYSTTSFFPDNQTIDLTPFLKQGSSKKGAIIGGVVGGVAFLLIVLALFFFNTQFKRAKKVPRVIGDILGATELKGPINYRYKDLKIATKNFSEENKLGGGGFGDVYKGTLKNGKIVAVKKLALGNTKRIEEDFESEVKLISNVHHRNLVRLLGCCSKGPEKILVYEYMKNNSLDKFLFDQNKGSLNWKQRYDIILGTARGLAYLHEEFYVCIIHRDIKTNNILLDDDLQPRISDFGLARLLPTDQSHLSTKFAGTLGYTAPEYAIQGQLSEKADTYSYGVVVLEIISGQKSIELKVDPDAEGEFLLQQAWKLYEKDMHLKLVDNTLKPNEYDPEEMKKIIEIGLLCTQASPAVRPTMSEVVLMLRSKGILGYMKPTMPVFIETNSRSRESTFTSTSLLNSNATASTDTLSAR